MPRRAIGTTLLTAAVVLLTLGGCPNNNGNNDPNDTNNNGTINDQDEFTEARKDLVRTIVTHVRAIAGVFATLHPLADERLMLDAQTFGEFGTCPEVTWVTSINGAGTITIEYGDDGCNAAATGAATVSGRLDITSLISSGAWRVQPRRVVIDGRALDGALTLTEQATTADPNDANDIALGESTRTWSAEVNFEHVDLGDFRGTVVLAQRADGQFTLSGTDVRIDDDDTLETWLVTFDGVKIDPLAEDNFIPLGGALSFRDDALVTILVEFTARSAERGIVRVTVGNGSRLNFEATTP